MKLTGKCLEDFEKWITLGLFCNHRFYQPNVAWFYTLPLEMQFGVYQDFFDSVGYDVNVKKFRATGGFFYTIFDKSSHSYQDTLNSINEARTKAIEKANEIYNENS